MPSKRSFTLIELLVVIAIIGILSGLIVISMNGAINSANDAKRKSNIDEIRKAVLMYNASNGSYPIQATQCNVGDSSASGCSTLDSALIPAYFTTVPTDPSGSYYTYQSANGTDFSLNATLSNSTSYTYTASTGFSSSSSSWTCGSTFTDSRNSKTYNTVLIGSQCWMKENLDYDNGCSSKTWVNSTDVGWCGYYTGGPFANEGLLYQWSAAMASTSGTPGICPSGWHVPSHDEWTTLERAVCTSTTCNTDFPYDTTTIGWRGTNEGSKLSTLTSGGTNSSGFTSLLPGYRNIRSFDGRSADAYLWSRSAYDSSSAWIRGLASGDAAVNRGPNSEAYAFSVRCLKD